MKMPIITAAAQIILSVIFLVAYGFVMGAFLGGWVHVAPVWRDQIGVLLGVLTGGVTTILAFWFARQRPPDHGADHEKDPPA